MLRNDGKTLSQPHISQISTVVLQNCEKSAVKHFIKKSMLFNFVMSFNFVHLPTTPRPRPQATTAG